MNVFIKPEIANSYDEYYQSYFGKKVDEIERNIIDCLIQKVPKTEMLELGCGTGHWTKFFSSKDFNVTGIDTSKTMLDIAKGKNINAKFTIANAQNIPFPDESVQIISSITMLEFVDNQDKVIQEIYRVLKKNAWFILGFLNKKSILGLNKDNSETFKNANFMTKDIIKLKLDKFEIIDVKSGVYLNSDYVILDDKKHYNIEPVFIGILAQKK
jgi:ubiquinone/menaquinone biosynthesis C-methylase UbiE